MGIIGTMAGAVGGFILEKAGPQLIEWAYDAVTRLLGDKADDGLRDRIARGLVEAARDAASHALLEHQAAKNLDDEAARVLGAIAAIDVDALFTPKGPKEAGPVEVSFTCELTVQSWTKVLAAEKRGEVKIDEPTQDQRDIFDAVGVIAGTVITISDTDRRVPAAVAEVLGA